MYRPHLNPGPPVDGSFDPGDLARGYVEPATAALLTYIGGLTVMVPEIAAAIKDHSTFADAPRERAEGTLRSALRLSLGSSGESADEARRLWKMHTTINGVHQGIPYDANDMALQADVGVDIFNGIETGANRWGKPFGRERESAYQRYKGFTTGFGIDPVFMPATVRDYDEYVNTKIESGTLLQTPASRELAQSIFRMESERIPHWFTDILSAVAITSLDPRLQEQADLIPTARDIVIARRFDTAMRQTYRRIPVRIRRETAPALLAARRKLASR